MNLRDRRIQYETAGLNFDDLDESPVQQWHAWYIEAVEAELAEPNAMAVSTIDAEGMPDSRIVLVRGLDDDGLTFFGKLGVPLIEYVTTFNDFTLRRSPST